MKKALFGVLTMLCCLSATAEKVAINYFNGSLSEAIERAQVEDKLIFVEAYAQWCGPCKIMAKQVFTNKKVGAFYNDNFINVRMDIDSPEGLMFRTKFPMEGIPFYAFLDKNSDLIHQDLGIVDAPEIINIGQNALKYWEDMNITDNQIKKLAPKMAEKLCAYFSPMIELNEALEVAKAAGNTKAQHKLMRKIEPMVKKFETFWEKFEQENRGRMKNDYYATYIRMEVRVMNPKVYKIMYGE